MFLFCKIICIDNESGFCENLNKNRCDHSSTHRFDPVLQIFESHDLKQKIYSISKLDDLTSITLNNFKGGKKQMPTKTIYNIHAHAFVRAIYIHIHSIFISYSFTFTMRQWTKTSFVFIYTSSSV